MRKFFSVVALAITALLSLPNLAMATPVVWKDIQVILPEQNFDVQLGSLNAGPISINQWNDGSIQILANMSKSGVISSIDEEWDFNPFNLDAITGNTWKFNIGEFDIYSLSGAYINGLMGGDIYFEIFTRPIEPDPVEAPEPSTLALLILALASLVFARHYKSVQLSRIPARNGQLKRKPR